MKKDPIAKLSLLVKRLKISQAFNQKVILLLTKLIQMSIVW